MKFIHVRRNRQRGAALLVLLGVLAIGASWFLVSKLDALGANFAARDRNSNAAVLNRAKQALIGYVAAQALKPGENNPGSLPCPENPGDFNDPSSSGFDGRTGSGCGNSLKVGRFPWRTIGTEKLVDASGEPLWYVVSTNWGVPVGGNTSINSSSVGQLTLDGVPNAAVALIIAPGPALAVQAGACAAWNQARPVVGPPDWRNYLECDNANSPADVSFVTTGPAGSFNDQVMRVTVADLMPALEAAIADRIQREIVPPLKDVFLGPNWGLPAGARLYPFAAAFADPGPGAGTSTYAGAAGTYQGLLPFNQVDCTASAGNPRCLPGAALTSWATTPTAYDGGGWGYIQTQSCWWEPGNAARVCEGEYHQNDTYPANPGMRIEMQVTLNNVAMGLRAFDATRIQVGAKDNGAMIWATIAPGNAMTMNPDGSLTIRFWGDLPNIAGSGWGTYADYRIRIERLVVTDHALLDSTSTGVGATGWFVRNEWFRLLYYAAAQTHTAANLPGVPSCTTNANCLRLTTWPGTVPTWDKRALLILAGRALTGQARPSNLPTNYVEFQNGDGGTMYEQQPIRSVINAALRAPFNDRVVVIESN